MCWSSCFRCASFRPPVSRAAPQPEKLQKNNINKKRKLVEVRVNPSLFYANCNLGWMMFLLWFGSFCVRWQLRTSNKLVFALSDFYLFLMFFSTSHAKCLICTCSCDEFLTGLLLLSIFVSVFPIMLPARANSSCVFHICHLHVKTPRPPPCVE